MQIMKKEIHELTLEDFACLFGTEVKDISEMIEQVPTLDILPKGVDYQKYDRIFDQLKLPNVMFQYIIDYHGRKIIIR